MSALAIDEAAPAVYCVNEPLPQSTSKSPPVTVIVLEVEKSTGTTKALNVAGHVLVLV